MKLIKLFTFIFVLYFVLIYCSYAVEKQFFPRSIRNEMESDLEKFLRNIPQNDGQRQHINRVLRSTQYGDILFLSDSSFTPEQIERLSKSENLFSLIEVLDILSYNLKMDDSFSNWYLSRLVSLVENKPSLYMVSFLRFCQQSDGAYSEWFADPLAKIISSLPKEFSVGIQKANNWKKICNILQTGSFQSALNALTQYDKEYSNVRKLLTCLRE